MLRWRLVFGFVFVVALAAICWLDVRLQTNRAGLAVVPVLGALALLAAGELLRLFRVRDQHPLPWVVYAGTLLVIVAASWPYFRSPPSAADSLHSLEWSLLALAITILLAITGEILRYDSPQGVARNIALAMFAVLVSGLLLSFFVHLRFVAEGSWGMIAVISLVLTVKLGDTGAYATGRLFGRHKLAPRLSPGKTIEGFFGGLAFSVLGAWITFALLAPAITRSPAGVAWWRVVVYGIVLGTAGVVGDLAISMLKRDAGVKDSSTWLPGLGGVLDMLDSLLAAVPVAYLLWVLQFIRS